MGTYKGRHRVDNTPKIAPTVEALGEFDKWAAPSIPFYTNLGRMELVFDPASAGFQLFHLRNTTLTVRFDDKLNLEGGN